LATRKKKNKVRDRDKTKSRLLEAVSQIMRETGFSDLKVMKITRLIGKDKGVIRYHYNGLVNLQKLYIREKDYWPKFFERFRLSSDSTREEIEELFSEMLQESFRFFRNNPEMQKIILWQISEVNPLMRSISDARERDGAKLLSMTDPFFKGTDIDFRSVCSLLLGGGYYIVMHAQTNKSTVAGIDANLERDREKILRTIRQIMTWAWEKAAEDQNLNIEVESMNLEIEMLEAIVAELIVKAKEQPMGTIAEPSLVLEAKRLEIIVEAQLLKLKNQTQLNTFLNMSLQKLTNICNQLYAIYGSISPETSVILELLDAVKNVLPNSISPQLQLPAAFIELQSPIFNARWKQLRHQLASREINPLLIDIASVPVLLFEPGQQKFTWGDYIWLKRFFEQLENIDWSSQEFATKDEILTSQLIRIGFNHQRFFAYCYRLIRKKVDVLSGKKQKLQELARRKTLILQDIPLYEQRYESSSEKLSVLLCNWVDAEIAQVSEMEPDNPAEGFYNPFKLLLKMNILSTAFWYKLQYDHGVFDEANLDILAEKVTKNCSTKQQPDISVGSLKTKFYTKERNVIIAIEQLLVRMLEDVRRFL